MPKPESPNPSQAKAPSIKVRLRAAKTVTELEAVLREAETYRFASGPTRRSWQRIRDMMMKKFGNAATGDAS